MTTLPLTPPRTHDAPRTGTRSGRLGEFLLVGGVTLVLFPASWALQRVLGLDASHLAVGATFFYAAHVLNDPHFAVTYLLFYRDGRARALGGAFAPWQRGRYLVAGVVVPAALASWAITAVATGSADMIGMMLQLMFLLVGWHYVKQGFGVMVVLSARRGVRFTPRERLAILAHCYAGWAYAWASPFDPGRDVEDKGVVFTTFAHPTWLEPLALTVFVATTVALAVVLFRKRAREGPLPLLTPLTALLCSIWAWSVFSSIDPLVAYAVPALHAVQYLYFVWLLEGNRARAREGPPSFGTPRRTHLVFLALPALALGLFLFDLAPMALDHAVVPTGGFPDAPAIGTTPCFAALYAFVNIHHFFMDAVIWRRDNPQTRYLLD